MQVFDLDRVRDTRNPHSPIHGIILHILECTSVDTSFENDISRYSKVVETPTLHILCIYDAS